MDEDKPGGMSLGVNSVESNGNRAQACEKVEIPATTLVTDPDAQIEHDLVSASTAEVLPNAAGSDLSMVDEELQSSQNAVTQEAGNDSYEIKYSLVGTIQKVFVSCCLLFVVAIFVTTIRSHLAVLLPLCCSAMVVPFLFANAGFRLSPEGIRFSVLWFYSLGTRRARSWEDLHSVQLVYPMAAVPEDSPIAWRGEKFSLRSPLALVSRMYSPWLVLDFRSGGCARIALQHLTKQQAQTLFKALETWSDPSRFASEVVNLERSLLLDTEDVPTFTRLWEDQLNAQYVSTNYVPLPTNYQLGEYSIVMQLSAGGMAAVYLANSKNGDKKVVIKEAVAPPGCDERQRQKSRELFEREARLLMKLNHPMIAGVVDYFVERNRDYLVLEYINGRSLKQVVKEEGKQKEKNVLNWCKQIARALEYLHSQTPPILHRDLTPDNLILTGKGQIKLVDFGAAREYVGAATGTFIGKQCYIPPEQLRGKAVPQSDLYALGATMQFLLTGLDPVALSQSHPRESVASITAASDRLVATLTEIEPEARPESASAVLRLLDETTAANSGFARLTK